MTQYYMTFSTLPHKTLWILFVELLLCFYTACFHFCVSYICKQNALKGPRFNFIRMGDIDNIF